MANATDLWITTEHPAIGLRTPSRTVEEKIWDSSRRTGQHPESIRHPVRARTRQGRLLHPDHGAPRAGRGPPQERRGAASRSAAPRTTACTTCRAWTAFMSARSAKASAASPPSRRPVALAHNPLSYGAHPYHHIGMPGNVIMPQELVKEWMVHVMLGLWNDGFRKQDHRQQPRPALGA